MVDQIRCSERVFNGWHEGTCSRRGSIQRRGKAYCRQHDPVAVEAKKQAREGQWRAVEAERKAIEKVATQLCERLKRVHIIAEQSGWRSPSLVLSFAEAEKLLAILEHKDA